MIPIDKDPRTLIHRLGVFSIPSSLIEETPHVIARAFAELGLVVVKCESLFHSRSLEYVAYSPYFEVLEEGSMPRGYEIIISLDEESNYKSVEVKNNDK